MKRLTSNLIIVTLLALPFFAGGFTQVRAQDNAKSLLLQETESVKTLPVKGKRWALIIGVDKYNDPQISQLKGSDNDARTLSDALVRFAGFPQDQVILLSTDQPAERQPTRVNILRRLSNLSAAVPKDGLLLVSFAGHGMERGGQAFLLPSDAQISDQVSFLEETAISINRVKDRIRETGVAQVVVLLDACRNDPGGRADAPNPLTTAYTNAFNFDVRNREVQAFATIYATGVGQRAYEYTEKKQGYFTWAVVEGLKGAAANEQGEITLSHLVRYVQETVPKRIAIDLGSGKQQKPFAHIEGYRAEDLVIAVGAGVVSSSTAPSTTVDSLAIELSFWDSIKNSTSPEEFKAYLDKYPDGQFAALARNKLRTLGSPGTAEPVTTSEELIFWSSIKNSENPEEFKAYLKKYPDGMFADLAKARLNSAKPAATETKNAPGGTPAAASSKGATENSVMSAEDIARNTKSHSLRNGSTKSAPRGTLYISPVGIEFKTDKGKNLSFKCADVIDVGTSSFGQLLFIKTTSGTYHFNELKSFFRTVDMGPIANEVRDTCKLAGAK